jgi:hypothetical protein
MPAPFQTVPQRLAALVGPHELLDIIKAAEDADKAARDAKRRADEAVAKFARQHGQPFLRWPEARRIAAEEVARVSAPTRKRRAA